MSKIFLCYRRKQSAAHTGRIQDHLRHHFGDNAVFMDIDSIPAGVDLRDYITSAVNQCGILLTVIGRNWVGKTAAHRKIDSPRDFVRIEIEAALERDIPVIPILIDGVRMPGEADLPPSLARLAYCAAIDVDLGQDFPHHVDRLIKGIEFHLQRSPARPPPLPPSPTKPDKPVIAGIDFRAKRLTNNSLSMTLVLIEPGSFLMGSTKDQVDQLMRLFPDTVREWFDDEQPQHRAEITRPFFLGIHQVTQGQYREVVGENPSAFQASDDLPVESVSWLNAVLFCNKLSEREKRTPFYQIDGSEVTLVGGNGYRLPTEAEWECACRAGSTTQYPFGDDPGGIGEHAWYWGNSESKTHPVGQKLPNVWGVYDMLGNVWEWCQDGWYDDAHYTNLPAADPLIGPNASHRVFRGGSWLSAPRICRPAARDWYAPEFRYDCLGFRVASVQE
jgi:formylglycine-generating enzyme required for sulfatase activity